MKKIEEQMLGKMFCDYVDIYNIFFKIKPIRYGD